MRFICDAMLAKLGRWLRMAGYDTKIASNKEKDEEILDKAIREDRIILTRDKNLSRYKRAIYITSDNLQEQLEQTKKLGIEFKFPEESFCPVCGGELVKEREIWVCKECKKRYWKGSHWKGILKRFNLSD